MKYPEYLQAFLNGLRVSEFIKINPLLKEYSGTTKCFLKVDYEVTVRLAKIVDLQKAIAKILHLNSAALQIVDLKEGCVVVTFLIRTPVAELVFHECTVFTEEQQREFRDLSVLWLCCNNHTYDFTIHE